MVNSNIVFTLNQDRIQTVNSLIILNKDDYLINIKVKGEREISIFATLKKK